MVRDEFKALAEARAAHEPDAAVRAEWRI